MSAQMLPRGIRNNNPGNIRRMAGTTWLGEAEEQNDPDFVQFATPEYGLRAIALILASYKIRDGITTIEGAIRRWSATDQDAYVANVAEACHVPPDETVDLEQYLPYILPAIVAQECADYAYPEQTILNGISLARGTR